MSRRTAEANKAIRLAWERERKLIRDGKGTRDWSVKQQEDILNPDIGKAYDEYGRAFEGQHMKSVEKYPEYQGDPDNIQFLTKDEHLEAHRGNWQKPTNWYYDPNTKEYIDFGDSKFIPCKVVPLSDPMIACDKTSVADSRIDDSSVLKNDLKSNEESYESPTNYAKTQVAKSQLLASPEVHSNGSKAKSLFSNIFGWIKKHPLETIGVAIASVKTVIEFTGSVGQNKNIKKTKNDNDRSGSDNSNSSQLHGNNIDRNSESTPSINSESSTVPKANGTPKRPHIRHSHWHPYNTKNGKVYRKLEDIPVNGGDSGNERNDD